MIRTYKAHVDWISVPNTLRVSIDLGLGVITRRQIRIEGIDYSSIPNSLMDRARHSFIILLGGKDIFLQVEDDGGYQQVLYARVFLDARVADHPAVVDVDEIGKKLLEVGLFFRYMREKNFDVEYVKRVLNSRVSK